ncbi:MAG: hypothetical protein ABFR53_12730 [Actinomycetota bacterium]
MGSSPFHTAGSKLRPIDRELLRLRTWEELSIKDIAVMDIAQ